MRKRGARGGSWLALGALALLGAAPSGTRDAETRAAMREIVEALGRVLPLSLSNARFSDPARRDEIRADLGKLAEGGARLESHHRPQDAGFDFLSSSLARDTREILQRYQAERFAEARFLLHQVTDNCVACHSRLPDAQAHPLGKQLFEDPAIAGLPAEERVELEVATRQFERALDSYEALFADPAVTPSDLDLMGTLDGYLELCLRVQRDPLRPAAALEKLAARPDVSPPLRATLKEWVKSLRELAKRPAAEPSLAAARELVEAARDQSRFPDDRRALVLYVAASGLLQRWLDAGPHPAAELGEAYYWLGLIESHVGRSFWLSQTESFLEASIRSAPGEPSADEAWGLLEEFVVSGYTGSAGGRVPEDVRARLDELRALIDAARPSQVELPASR
jgi:hypothetical protein